MYEIIKEAKFPIYAWVRGVEFEETAKTQLRKVACLPFVFEHVAVMPDCHAGNGSTVGTVLATENEVIPATVGADLYCGMYAVLTNLHKNNIKDVAALRTAIESLIPHGRTNEGRAGDKGAWGNTPKNIHDFWDKNIKDEYKELTSGNPNAHSKNSYNHLGTLGSGNHFIEVSLDLQDRVWFVLHSGSRGMGARFGQYFTSLAKKFGVENHLVPTDTSLYWLQRGTKEFDDYLLALRVCEKFAYASRNFMMQAMFTAAHKFVKTVDRLEEVHCHHNYVSFENHFGKDVIVTRKGAIRAGKGELGIIPGSMGAKSYIVSGLGNFESFSSASHGAGRRMSRGDAKKLFTTKDLVEATQGIDCRKDKSVVDEAPGCYKDIDAIMEAQKDLVEIKETLRQVLCIKG